MPAGTETHCLTFDVQGQSVVCVPRALCVCVPFGSTADMESEMDSAIRHGRLVIPDSARGRIGADAVSLEAAMQQEYIVIYGPFHALEMIRVTQEIAEHMQTVAESTGDDKTEARRILKDLVEERNKLVDRRDRATQRLVSAFDPKEAKRLFANAVYRNALVNLRDPASVASAILAIHRARHGGNVSIFDTAAALPSEIADASAGVSMYDHFENIATMLRSIALLPNPEAAYFQTLPPEAKNFLAEANTRVVKFICIMTASAETQAARSQIEAFDTSFLENAPFNVFLARLVSQKSLATGPDLAGDSAPSTATVLGAQGRPPRRLLKDITCFGCRKSGHYQRDCPDAPGAGAAGAASLSAAELAVFRRMMAAETAELDGRAVSAAARAGPFTFDGDDDEEDDENA